jgi:DNA-binding CsgD family transcriptional regulator
MMNPRRTLWKFGTTKRGPANPCSGASIFSARAWDTLSRSLWLSRRELQIVRGVFDDQTEFAIAANLHISTHTVHTHFERLHRKLAVVDRVSLVVRVVEEFLKLTTLPGSIMPPLCATLAAGRCPLPQMTHGAKQLAFPSATQTSSQRTTGSTATLPGKIRYKPRN